MIANFGIWTCDRKTAPSPAAQAHHDHDALTKPGKVCRYSAYKFTTAHLNREGHVASPRENKKKEG